MRHPRSRGGQQKARWYRCRGLNPCPPRQPAPPARGALPRAITVRPWADQRHGSRQSAGPHGHGGSADQIKHLAISQGPRWACVLQLAIRLDQHQENTTPAAPQMPRSPLSSLPVRFTTASAGAGLSAPKWWSSTITFQQPQRRDRAMAKQLPQFTQTIRSCIFCQDPPWPRHHWGHTLRNAVRHIKGVAREAHMRSQPAAGAAG